MTDEKKKGGWPRTTVELGATGYKFEYSAPCHGKTCNSKVFFYRTPKGKLMPLSMMDPKEEPRRYQPHFADCPDEKAFRR